MRGPLQILRCNEFPFTSFVQSIRIPFGRDPESIPSPVNSLQTGENSFFFSRNDRSYYSDRDYCAFRAAIPAVYCRTRDGDSRRSGSIHQQGQHDKLNVLREIRARATIHDNLEPQPPGKADLVTWLVVSDDLCHAHAPRIGRQVRVVRGALSTEIHLNFITGAGRRAGCERRHKQKHFSRSARLSRNTKKGKGKEKS